MIWVLLALAFWSAPLAGQDSTRIFAGQRVRLEHRHGAQLVGTFLGRDADTVRVATGRQAQSIPLSRVKRVHVSDGVYRVSAQKGLLHGALAGLALEAITVGYFAYMDNRAVCDPCTQTLMSRIHGTESILVSIPIVTAAVGLVLADRQPARDRWREIVPRW